MMSRNYAAVGRSLAVVLDGNIAGEVVDLAEGAHPEGRRKVLIWGLDKVWER